VDKIWIKKIKFFMKNLSVELPTIIRNFITEVERDELNKWCLDNYKNPKLFRDANMGKKNTRLTTRYSHKNDLIFPDISYKIRNRIITRLEITNSLVPDFKDGIVCGIGFNSGDIYKHTDPIWYPDTFTLHCNIISQKPKSGGITIIDEIEYETNETDLLCYPVSELPHSVNEIQGDTERILWVFGFSIPLIKYELKK
jgi:hypothetical protein